MIFAVQFQYSRRMHPSDFRIFELNLDGIWACVYPSGLYRLPAGINPEMDEQDGDFTAEAESLDDFMKQHIDMFL